MQITDLISKRASDDPSSICIIDAKDQCRLSYSEFENLSELFKENLLMISSGEILDRVAICLADQPRSLMISIVGILKSHSTYIPIDPQNPKERIEYLLDQSQPKMVVVDSITDKLIPDKYQVSMTHLAKGLIQNVEVSFS